MRAIRNIFKLARLNRRRVKRIYIYNWFGRWEPRPRWDSGVVEAHGRDAADLPHAAGADAQVRTLIVRPVGGGVGAAW